MQTPFIWVADAAGIVRAKALPTGGVWLSGAGTASNPAVAQEADPNTGLYFPAADQVSLTAGGQEQLRSRNDGASYLESIVQHRFSSGSATVPGITFASTNTGFSQTGSSIVASQAGDEIARFTSRFASSSRQIEMTTGGTAALPSYSWVSDNDNGLFNPAADTVALSTGGSERFRIDSAGQAALGTTSTRLSGSSTAAGNKSLTIYEATNGGGGLELATAAQSGVMGRIAWVAASNTAANATTAFIDGTLVGSASTGQGGMLRFWTRVDGGAGAVQVAIADTGVLTINKGITTPTTPLTADTTLTTAHHVVLVDASGGNVTISLPAASGLNGRTYVIKRVDSSGNTVTIDPAGSETIDGSATSSVGALVCRKIITNGSNWFIL